MIDGGGFSPPYDFGLVTALRTRGVDVELLLPAAVAREWQDPDAIPTTGGGRLLRGVRRAGKVVGHAARLATIAWTVLRGRVDVVHFQWLPLPALDLVLLRWLHGRVPLVFTMHNTSLFHGTSAGIQGWKLDRCFPLFDRIVVHSEYSRDRAIDSGAARREQLCVIPHGAFVHYAQLAPSRRERTPGPIQLLFAGAIKPYKGLGDLIEALGIVASERASGSWHLTVAGHPSYPMAPLQQRARDLGIDADITWSLRHQSERELARLLADTDAVILPYREIDQSGVLLAAVGMYRPVIASAVGAFPEVLGGEGAGLLVQAGQPEALADAIVRFVHDERLRARSAEQMVALAQGGLSWEQVASKTEEMYRGL